MTTLSHITYLYAYTVSLVAGERVESRQVLVNKYCVCVCVP